MICMVKWCIIRISVESLIIHMMKNSYLIILYSTIPYTNWKIVNVIPRDILMQKSFKLKRQTQIFGIIFIVLVVLMASYTSIYISTPITRLAKVVKKVELGDLSVRVSVDSKDEVGQLGVAFNNMLAQINNLMNKVYQEENKKREAELKALQAQINPHFLYNTLNTIKWMAVIQKADSISKMIVSLIKLLEFSGKRIGEFVSIEQELEHAKNYIFLQKIRYNDKFIVNYDIDEKLLHYKTIKLILQPIIENAIFHGIEPKGGVGTIQITLSQINDKLKFEIIDDGIGMDINIDKDRKFSGLGIENVNERLVRYFGEQSSLKIYSSINRGTKVMFYLPIIIDEGTGENA
ncbi:MAG: sensor histidine kinase [Clostridia bacterium]|nr:sensor histidine kinase [Clostridia bacterium]